MDIVNEVNEDDYEAREIGEEQPDGLARGRAPKKWDPFQSGRPGRPAPDSSPNPW